MTLAIALVSAVWMAACSNETNPKAGTPAPSGPQKPLAQLAEEHAAAMAKTPLEVGWRDHDFGQVPIDGGDVETTFRVSNGGLGSVTLVSIYTSCGCTTAVLEFEDGSREGPFGMPGHELPTRLNRSLAPGEGVQVRVRFDPAAHGPAGLGRVTRGVMVHTRDGGGVQLAITAEVVPA